MKNQSNKFWCVLLLCTIALVAAAYKKLGADSIGSTSQPLVGGPTVDQQTRRELGLVTLLAPMPAPVSPGTIFPGPAGTKTCSAQMLNDYWAITASHCIDNVTDPSLVTLQAVWTGVTETRQASKLHSFAWTHNNLDIALVMINLPFPRDRNVHYPQLSYRPTSDLNGQRVEAFGRGISVLAFQSPAGPMATQADGLFRSSDFEVFQISREAFTYRSIQGAGRATAGGDSGGPSYFRVWDDPSSPNREIVRLVAGIHSRCQFECLPGQTCEGANFWTWVSNVTQCTDASVEPILHEIQIRIAEIPDGPEIIKPNPRLDPIITGPTKPAEKMPGDVNKDMATPGIGFQTTAKDLDKVSEMLGLTFTGTFTTITAANSTYIMTLKQTGNIVNGQYFTVDGSLAGVINGNLVNGTLVYQWSQKDGQKGSGKFVLSSDGKSFQGWWNYSSDDPNKVEGSWNGNRR